MDNEDEDAQRRYKRRILRELYTGMHNRRIGPGMTAMDAHFATTRFMTRI